MPPLHPGDPGDGHGEDGRDEDVVGFVPPLPPEDRLWRHPSEVAQERARPAAPPAASLSPRRTAVLVLASGLVGAGLAVAGVAVLGGFDHRPDRPVAVRSATPLESTSTDGVAGIVAEVAPSVAALEIERDGRRAAGSAVVLRADGILVTDAGLVADADGVEVVLDGGHAGPANVLGTDATTGVAVLQVDADDLETATLGSAATVAVGDRTVAVGADPDAGWDALVSTGVVAALDRRIEAADGTTRYGMLVVDKPFTAGTAGGAVVDAAGAVVGIVSNPEGLGRTDVGLATPIDAARFVVDQLLAHGHVEHVWLGVQGTDLEPEDATALEVRGGAMVTDVAPGGPAARAGLEAGDVIVAVDGDATPSMAGLIALLQLHEPGAEVVLEVHRDGRERPVRVTLAAKDH